MTLEEVLSSIEASRGDIADAMCAIIRVPALAPVNGGQGEGLKADVLAGLLEGYDSVVRVDVPDDHDPSVLRPNILAKKNGRMPGTVWIVAHIDVVPAGNWSDWTTPPFEPRVEDGKIYGRGTEDNGQALISSLFASKFIKAGTLTGRSIGIAYVADEETTSQMGIGYLLKNTDHFTKDDIILVPDWGVPGGYLMDVAEKSLMWVQVTVKGKTTHGSTPHKGLNAFRVSSALITDLVTRLEERFGDRDELFDPPFSTFEPTKSPATVENVNTIPGIAEFCLDMRFLPRYDPDEVLEFIRSVIAEHSVRTGAEISVAEIQRNYGGRASATDTAEFKAIRESINSVIDGEVEPMGVGGATCANFFRLAGLNAYVWECGGGTLHAPDEHVFIDNIVTDAKAFATVFHKLCL